MKRILIVLVMTISLSVSVDAQATSNDLYDTVKVFDNSGILHEYIYKNSDANEFIKTLSYNTDGEIIYSSEKQDNVPGINIKKSTSYGLFGITLGNPGGLNVVTGVEGNIFGFRIQAGYAQVIKGAQFNFLINTMSTKNVSQNLSFAIGIQDLGAYNTYKYLGLF